jgi:hypothetical protein
MLIVGTDLLAVDQALVRGELRCPGCAGELRPWSHAGPRGVRHQDVTVVVCPRRSRCSGCRCTHVLLPSSMLVRRADAGAVIGAALEAKARGVGHRPIARALGRPVSTVRGWLRRFCARAGAWRVVFTALLHALDTMAAPITVRASVFADAVEVLALASAAATRRFGPRPPWQFASLATSGLLLAPAPAGGAG